MRRVMLILVALIAAASAARAGTAVLITLNDGSVIDAETLDYAEGIFTVQVAADGAMRRIAAQTIRRIKFKQTQLVETPRQMNRSVAIRAVRERRFSALLRAFEAGVAAGGRVRVEQIARDLEQQAKSETATDDQKRNAKLARVLALVSLREWDSARALYASLPADGAVEAFERELPIIAATLRNPEATPPAVPAPTRPQTRRQ